MSRGTPRRRPPIAAIAILAGLLAGLMAVTMSQPAAADVPTPTGIPKWTQGADGTYKWGDGVNENGDPQPMPSWLGSVMTDVLETGWADPETNNSDTVRYTYSTTNDVIVRFSTESIEACEAVTGWLGCADATGAPTRSGFGAIPPPRGATSSGHQ